MLSVSNELLLLKKMVIIADTLFADYEVSEKKYKVIYLNCAESATYFNLLRSKEKSQSLNSAEHWESRLKSSKLMNIRTVSSSLRNT